MNQEITQNNKVKQLLTNPLIKNILSGIAVAVFGFILLNLAFLFDFLFQSSMMGLIKLIITPDPDTNTYMNLQWFPPLMHISFVVIIGLISWLVFRSKLKVLYKAIYMTVPVAVVLMTVGIYLYRWPLISYAVGSLLCFSTLYYFYRSKQPWLYYYVVILVGLTLAIFTLLGGQV